MIYDDKVTWKTVTNTVASRMRNGSFIHQLIPIKKLRRTTKALNIRLHKISGVKTYAQYVKAKTAVLRNVSDDDDTDNSATFSDEDYSNLYKNDKSLKDYIKKASSRSIEFSSAEEFDDIQYSSFVRPAKKKTTQAQCRKEPTSQRRSPRFANVGWQEILKRKKQDIHAQSSKAHSFISDSSKISTTSTTLNNSQENVSHVPKHDHAETAYDHDSSGKISNHNGTSDALETSRNCKISTEVSNLELQATDSNTEEKVVEHCIDDRPDAVKKIKRNLKTILDHFNRTHENHCSLIENPNETTYLDKTLQLSQANPICQSTPLNEKKFDKHYPEPLLVSAVNHPKDSGIDEDSIEECLGDWKRVIAESKKDEERDVEKVDKDEERVIFKEKSKKHSKCDMEKLKKGENHVIQESKDQERNVTEESWNNGKRVTKESKKNENPVIKESRRHEKCNVVEIKEDGVNVIKQSKKDDKCATDRLKKNETRDMEKSKRHSKCDVEKLKKDDKCVIQQSMNKERNVIEESWNDEKRVTKETKKDENPVIKESRRHGKCNVEELKEDVNVIKESKKNGKCAVDRLTKIETRDIDKSKRHSKCDVEKLKKDEKCFIQESMNKETNVIEESWNDEKRVIKETKKDENPVIKESRRHGKCNVEELKEDVNVIKESKKNGKCAVDRLTKIETRDIDKSKRHSKCDVEKLKKDEKCFIQESMNKETNVIEESWNDEKRVIKETKKDENPVIKESRRHGKCNVEELKEDVNVIKESKKNGKCAVGRLTKIETRDIDKSKRHSKCDVEKLKKDEKCFIQESMNKETNVIEESWNDEKRVIKETKKDENPVIKESRRHGKCKVEELKEDVVSVIKESKKDNKRVIERLKKDEKCVIEESEDDDDETAPAVETCSTATEHIDETVVQSPINNLTHEDSDETIENNLLDEVAAAPNVLDNTEMVNHVNQKQKPRVTSTEIVNKRYRIISCSESQLDPDEYAESEDLDIHLSMSPQKEAFENLDEEEEEEDTMSDFTKMRLDRLKRLNLIVDSDSCSSADEDEERNIESTKNKSLKRSIKEESDEDSIQSLKSVDDLTIKNGFCEDLRQPDKQLRKKKCSWKTPEKTCETMSEISSCLNNDSTEDTGNEENMEKQMLSEEVGDLQSNISILNDSLTIGRPCNLDELIEDEELVIDPAIPSFTMKNIDKDDELYILDIPKTVDEKELLGKKFILTENRLQLGEEKFKASYRDLDFVTCVFGTGKSRKPFKTVNIKPMARIIARKKSKNHLLIKSPNKSPSDLENCTKRKTHTPKSKKYRLGKQDLSLPNYFENRERSVDLME